MKINTFFIIGFFLLLTCSFPIAVLSQVHQLDDNELISRISLILEANRYIIQAKDNIQEGDLKLALINYNNAVGSFPQNDRIYISRGKVKIQLGLFKEALSDFTLAIIIEPNINYSENSLRHKIFLQKNAEAFFYRGQVKYLIGDYDGAMEDYNNSLELHESSNAYLSRGSIKKMRSLHEKAVIDFNNAIILNENNDAAYIMRGLSLIHLGETHNACLDFSKVINSDYLKDLKKLYCDD